MPAATHVASGISSASLLDFELEDVAFGRQRVLHAEHELHVQRRLEQAVAHVVHGVVEHREIEDLDLGLHVVAEHFGRELVDQIG